MYEEKQCKLLAKEIKAQRIKRNWTIKELSQIARLSVSTISKIETGNYNFNIETLWKLCKAFKIRAYDLIKNAHKQKDTSNEVPF